MIINVALDGTKKRDLIFYQGDDLSIVLKVYAHDGDITPIVVENVRFDAPAGTVPMGVPFTVPYNYIGRSPYRIVGEVAGITTTLVTGIIQTPGGWPSVCCWGYGNFPFPWGVVGKADNITVLDEGQNFTSPISVEGALAELGQFKKEAGDLTNAVAEAQQAATDAETAAQAAVDTLAGTVKKVELAAPTGAGGVGTLDGRSVQVVFSELGQYPAVGTIVSKHVTFPWDSGFLPVYLGDGKWGVKGDPYALDVAFNSPNRRFVYVDQATGSDTAKFGTSWADAFKTMTKALTWAQTNQATYPNMVFLVKATIYDRAGSWPAVGLMPTAANLSIRAVGGRVELRKEFEPQTWTYDAATKTYRATRNTVGGIFDSSLLDKDGLYTRLPKQVGTTISALTGPNQWASDGVTVWLRTFDDRAPDADIHLSLSNKNGYVNNLNGTLFMRGIDFMFGDVTFQVDTDSTVVSKQVFVDCSIRYSNTGNGLMVFGTDGCYQFDSRYAKAFRDNINYTQSADGTKQCKGLEVNVTSIAAGESGDSNNNASTSHNSSIIQRIGGLYLSSEGPLLPDVNDGRIWNCGTTGGNSRSPAPGTSYNYYISGTGVGHYDYITSYGSVTDVVVQVSTGAVALFRGGRGLRAVVQN